MVAETAVSHEYAGAVMFITVPTKCTDKKRTAATLSFNKLLFLTSDDDGTHLDAVPK